MISKLIFLSILSFVFALFDLYFYKRFLAFFTKNRLFKKTLIAALIAWEIGFVLLSMSQLFWGIRPFFASVLGFLLFTVVLGAVLEILRRFAYFERTKYAVFAVFAIFFLLSFYTAALPPQIKQINFSTDSKELKGKRFAVIADAHIDPSKKEFAADTVDRLNKLDTDIVLIVGDMCDGRIEDVKDSLLPFARLKSRYGVFFAPGNHEYYYNDFDVKMEFLSGLGIKTLVNQNETIEGFSMVGVSDSAAARVNKEEPDAKKAFIGAKRPSILLAHQPKTAKDAISLYHPNFVFCGHTHNGQIWPFNYLVSLVQPFVYGEYVDGESRVVVTSGVGLWGPPMRLFSRSEILVVTFF